MVNKVDLIDEKNENDEIYQADNPVHYALGVS